MKLAAALTVGLLCVTSSASARDLGYIAGSSTVNQYVQAIFSKFAEEKSGFIPPTVESNGSGHGLEAFCKGLFDDAPDIAMASRRIKASEIEACHANGVQFSEILVGRDGIVVANNKNGPFFWLTREELTIALAANGPLPTKWHEVTPDMPSTWIEVTGSAPGTGTRAAFLELVLHEGCKTTEKVDCDAIGFRDDGVYVDDAAFGEDGAYDYNNVLPILDESPFTVSVFAYAFYLKHQDRLKTAFIEGVRPTSETLADGSYPLSRKLYIYAKDGRTQRYPELEILFRTLLSEEAASNGGFLNELGLVPLSEEEQARSQSLLSVPDHMTLADLTE